ncbi:zinc ribbon domain-containing protein [Macrococcus capreoli]|uniref:zinc ribbon domain-containing protein n=1 Tax=Macrococcus capreoli TaxID=2982690 RepID=UPI0021D606A0|nr:zinc ribbon domain-containing protein [Macrococcus sp. TMW 2.2395]MCU7558629.1 zinc ribbon domain-containing protein [Macrococcus sp. TMW 2.2395]
MICQSCGKLLTINNKADSNELYCNYCYQNGNFKENITLEEMKERVRKSLLGKPIPNNIKKKIIEDLSTLDRWKEGSGNK